MSAVTQPAPISEDKVHAIPGEGSRRFRGRPELRKLQCPVRHGDVVSKLKCPVLLASEVPDSFI